MTCTPANASRCPSGSWAARSPTPPGLVIRRVVDDKRRYIGLLLLADESTTLIDSYLDRGTVFVLEADGVPASIVVATEEGAGVVEVQNVATDPAYRRRGYATRLLDHVATHFRGRARTLLVGTGDSPVTVPFYRRRGFVYSHRIARGVADLYDHPIIEAGVQLIDKVFYTRDIPPLAPGQARHPDVEAPDASFIGGDGTLFRYRAAALIVRDGEVLLATNDVANEYYSVGGGVHLGETAEDALRRELREETGWDLDVGKLAVVHEHFFLDSETHRRWHELALYYSVAVPGDFAPRASSTSMTGAPERVEWVRLESATRRVRPSWLPEYLSHPHTSVRHIVTVEE